MKLMFCRFCWPLIVFLFLTASSFLSAQETLVVEGKLAQKVSLMEIKGIRFACGRGENLETVRMLIYSVIQESINFFHDFNPRIEKKIRQRLSQKKLKIRCVGDRSLFLRMRKAEAISQARFFSSYRITFYMSNLLGPFTKIAKHQILHELLHYVKIDNFSIERHNSAYISEEADQDAVYSCSYLVYPLRYMNIDAGKALKTCLNIK